MMVHMATQIDIEHLPRGGPDASWLDRQLETDRLEYLDRDDVEDRKRAVVRALDRVGSLLRQHQTFARLALEEVADVADPKILELGSGHGALSRALLALHPSAQLTITDIEPTSVANIAAGDLGSHPRATVRQMDATAIDAPDGFYDLVVFAMSFHHLPPAPASRVLAEGTRAADKLLIVDLARPSPVRHVLQLAWMLPWTGLIPFVHDGFISSLRSYSPSALRSLAAHADPAITLELRSAGVSMPPMPAPQIVVASRLRASQ